MNVSITALQDHNIQSWRAMQQREAPLPNPSVSSGLNESQPHYYALNLEATQVGYGAIAPNSRLHQIRTVSEFYVHPDHRVHTADIFSTFVEHVSATAFEFHTADRQLNDLLSGWCGQAVADKIIFRDARTTLLPGHHTILHRFWPSDVAKVFHHRSQPVGDWVLEIDGAIAATGGVRNRFNPPYVDLFVEVHEPLRRRGLGSYLIQELKRICYDLDQIPCGRSSPDDIPSIKLLQKAGFAPCAQVLAGQLQEQMAEG